MSKVFYEGLLDRSSIPTGNQAGGQNTYFNSAGQEIPLQKYYNDMVQYIAPEQVVSECAEITFFNTGTSNMIVNGILFAPNTGISFDGNQGEIDVTKYNLGFSGAGQNTAFVVRKVYQ